MVLCTVSLVLGMRQDSASVRTTAVLFSEARFISVDRTDFDGLVSHQIAMTAGGIDFSLHSVLSTIPLVSWFQKA